MTAIIDNKKILIVSKACKITYEEAKERLIAADNDISCALKLAIELLEDLRKSNDNFIVT